MLEAEVALADNEVDRARALAESAFASSGASPEIRCRALELLGRVRRVNDLDGAREAFEQALATADAAGLAVWRLRALHELGTIDMFDHAGTGRLSEARRMAGELGAASTGAVIDLQLTAAAMFRFELDEAERHARSALAASTRLGLAMTSAIVLVFRAEVCALRRERAEMERFIALACAAAPGDPEIEGSALAGARGMLALLDGDMAGALDSLRPGNRRPRHRTPARPGALPRHMAAAARRARRRAGGGRDQPRPGHRPDRQPGQPGAARLRRRDPRRAGRCTGPAPPSWPRRPTLTCSTTRSGPTWPGCAPRSRRWPAAGARPRQWLEAAAGVFGRYGIEPLAVRCRQLLDGPRPSRWSRLGITDRQADVLRLVAAGISNKEIAARLHLSPRTVEKHVENLLRITAARSRTQLVAIAGPESD